MEEKWSAESLKRAGGAERGVDDGYKIIISYYHGVKIIHDQLLFHSILVK